MFREQVEEICEGADKQLGIETKLNGSERRGLIRRSTFGKWKGRDCPILQAFGQIIDDLEEAQMNMQTLLSMRHVGPFREPVQEQLTASVTRRTRLELWIKVQLLWTALEKHLHGHGICGNHLGREAQTRPRRIQKQIPSNHERPRSVKQFPSTFNTGNGVVAVPNSAFG